jgi:hypothetical protein
VLEGQLKALAGNTVPVLVFNVEIEFVDLLVIANRA